MPLKSLHHAHFSVSDMDRAESFASDFGLLKVDRLGDRLYMKTCGGDAYSYIAEPGERGFTGIGFTVDTREDLERAVAEHGATPIVSLDRPGGGEAVSLQSPEGFRIELLHGVKETESRPFPTSLILNEPGNLRRHHVAQSMRDAGPAHLFRLGHVGLFVRDLEKTRDWLVETLGMLVTDQLYVGNPDNKVICFLRLDRGEALTDHHTIFLAKFGDRSDCHHISFEVQDFEAQFRTHRFLQSQGWEPNWGVGRHPLGSHVFDTWFSPDRYRFETFSDTDAVTAAHKPGLYDMLKGELDIWSAEPPEAYFT